MKNSVAKHFGLSVLIIIALLFGCKPKQNTLFQFLPAKKTGLDFINTVAESDSFNILTYEYIYNGGGVGIADFNSDGLADLFFSGNQANNKIYLNKGHLIFEDITQTANVNIHGRWNSGVTIVDINNDGRMDVYVCATTNKIAGNRENMLFVNEGNDANGKPTFSEKAREYGIADDGYSVMASFFDYDLDGDLDLYILTNEKLNNVPTNYRPKITDGTSPNNDRLYRNNGNGTFTNVTREAGVTIEGFGLGLSVADFNADGWPDLYISNDYLSNDLLYLNNQNGTFTNRIGEFIGHQSLFSMGNDAADINNDALPEIITLDMLPEVNVRKKTTISNKTYQNYINNEKFGYEYQYVRNMLHLNNGLDKGIKFSEIGQTAGVYQTEWSWSPLFADFDNDGFKDLLITNGFPKDITDKDFSNYRAEVGRIASDQQLIDSIPIIKISNFAYKNSGKLSFDDVTNSWGLNMPSFSNGAAFADLDNDGDLDYVVNNINDVCFLYENTLRTQTNSDKTNFVRFRFEGDKQNISGIGTKVTLKYKGTTQFHENFTTRGFLSSVDPIAHFGVGDAKTIDTVIVQWPDGKSQHLLKVNTNQTVKVSYADATLTPAKAMDAIERKLFEKKKAPSFKAVENDVIDFNLQRTLPHKFSQAGPGIAVGDINGDELEDFVVGGGSGYPTTLFLQRPDGEFLKKNLQSDTELKIKIEEDEGLLLFDADNDQDLDLYIVSGSIEPASTIDLFQDRLYINDGRGNLRISKESLPNTRTSGSCVRAADWDADGDLDLFVGGRVNAGKYPLPATSYLLQNTQGKFTDETEKIAPKLQSIGMVTDALWTDFNTDGLVDLVVVGEFMPIQFFKNTGKNLQLLTQTGIESYVGWWNSIAPGDYDQDGDIDYVVGNLGQNNNYGVDREHPLTIYAKDFDGNGSIDPVLACYMKESMNSPIRKLYPVHFWDELNSQSPKFRNKFSHYREYGKTTIEKLFTPDELNGALIMRCNYLLTSYIENVGNNKFSIKALDQLTQVAPVNGMTVGDFNGDSYLDIAMTGNDYGNEVFAGRYDAFTGLVLLGDGTGKFNLVPSSRSGFYIPGDGKALASIHTKKHRFLIGTQNQDSLKIFSNNEQNQNSFSPTNGDSYAMMMKKDGKKERVEFYYGSGYLSQSSRKLTIADVITAFTVYDSKGKSKKIK
jgi:hypothetical protein